MRRAWIAVGLTASSCKLLCPALTMCHAVSTRGEGVENGRVWCLSPGSQQRLYHIDRGAAVSAVVCHEQSDDAARRGPRLSFRALAGQISRLWRPDRAVGLCPRIVRGDGGIGRG